MVYLIVSIFFSQMAAFYLGKAEKNNDWQIDPVSAIFVASINAQAAFTPAYIYYKSCWH